jgi:hypothetical protein
MITLRIRPEKPERRYHSGKRERLNESKLQSGKTLSIRGGIAKGSGAIWEFLF